MYDFIFADGRIVGECCADEAKGSDYYDWSEAQPHRMVNHDTCDYCGWGAGNAGDECDDISAYIDDYAEIYA